MQSDELEGDAEGAHLDAVGVLTERWLSLPDEQQAAELERLCVTHPEHTAELRRRCAFLRSLGVGADDSAPAELPPRIGDFVPLERLAGGGMGVVYRARQLSLGRDVALKLVRPELLYFEGARERFRREAATIAKLDHPGIVPVYSAGEERGAPYIAMQLVDGCTLAEVVASVVGRAPESLLGEDLWNAVRARASVAATLEAPELFRRGWTEAVATIVRDMSLALACAHERGVVHRDVKPSNVLLSKSGRAQLIDFGLTGSETSDGLTRTGSQVGTLHYMAPERLRGERGVDVRSDVYSAGVTLYELLALQAPYQAESRTELESRILDGRVDSLRVRNRRVDADLERVCLQAIAPEPERRYRDAGALAADLDRWLACEPVLARSPSVFERTARWTRRHKPAAALIVVVVALVVGLPTALWGLQRKHTAALESSLASEQAALADMEVANEIITRVLRDASPAYGDARDVTLYESLQKMATLAEEGRDAPRARAQILSMIGQIYLSRSDLDRAQPLLRRADEVLRTQGFEIDPTRATVLEKLGNVHKVRGELEQAREHYREAARVGLQVDPANENWAAMMLANEGATFIGAQNARARELMRDALRRFVPQAGSSDDAAWLKQSRLRLAKLEAALEDFTTAFALLDQVRAEIEAQAQPSVKDRLELASAEGDIASNAKDDERADRVLTAAVELAREKLGVSNTTSVFLFQLGRARFDRGAVDDARSLMSEALETRRAVAGPDAPATRQMREWVQRFFPELGSE